MKSTEALRQLLKSAESALSVIDTLEFKIENANEVNDLIKEFLSNPHLANLLRQVDQKIESKQVAAAAATITTPNGNSTKDKDNTWITIGAPTITPMWGTGVYITRDEAAKQLGEFSDAIAKAISNRDSI